MDLEKEDEVVILRRRVTDEAPGRGYQKKSDPTFRFEDMAISQITLKGLHHAKLTIPTDIQAASIPHALADRDILAAAKTGSGKTLAYLIPLLEKLYREKWDINDGLAAIIITPTRELSLQVFQVLRIVGKYHQYSAGLITGGKKEFDVEQQSVIRMNILVATPGRLLQHFEQTPGFDASQLQMLVLDEADRILDMGFKQQLDCILEYLPNRQTLLFSATQTKSIKDLARLSLNNPEYLSIYNENEHTTPSKLIQNYVICKLQEKLDVLFSFIKSHLKSKLIVFFSTCSQVRYVFECIRGMQPGIVLTALHGKIKQERRTSIYMDFVKRKAVCMFATDIAARGLDFPDVDWVIQVDAPEDSAMYIHRVGRTARYTSGGRALMMLLPSEEKEVLEELSQVNIPITKLTINTKFKVSVASRAAALLASRPECKLLAKKAFTGYLKSIQLLPNRSIDISTLPINEFSSSLGLPFTPPIPFVSRGNEGREDVRKSKNINRSLDKLKKQIKEAKEERKRAKENENKNENSINDVKIITNENDNNSDDEDELFQVKEMNDNDNIMNDNDIYNDIESNLNQNFNKRIQKKIKKKLLKLSSDGLSKAISKTNKIIFDDNNEIDSQMDLQINKFKFASMDNSDINERLGEKIETYTTKMKQKIDEGRIDDNIKDKQRINELHYQRRIRLKSLKSDENNDNIVELGNPHEDDSINEEDDSYESNNNNEDINDNDNISNKRKLKVKKLRKTKKSKLNDESYEDLEEQEMLALKLLQ